MIVTTEQIRTLSHQMEVLFLNRLEQFVAGLRSPGTVSGADNREFCAHLIARARARGLYSEFEIATFAACAVLAGDDFDKRDDLPFKLILSRPSAEPRLKAAQMKLELDRMRGAASPGAGDRIS